jgi:hypothetical protein
MIQWVTGILLALYYAFLLIAMYAVLSGCQNGGKQALVGSPDPDLRLVDSSHLIDRESAPTHPLILTQSSTF